MRPRSAIQSGAAARAVPRSQSAVNDSPDREVFSIDSAMSSSQCNVCLAVCKSATGCRVGDNGLNPRHLSQLLMLGCQPLVLRS